MYHIRCYAFVLHLGSNAIQACTKSFFESEFLCLECATKNVEIYNSLVKDKTTYFNNILRFMNTLNLQNSNNLNCSQKKKTYLLCQKKSLGRSGDQLISH